jgi:hypothetical protein
MMTRLLALALAATGLSVGGFQLGARQAQPVLPTEALPPGLPTDHALSVALREPNSSVSAAEKARLRKLIMEMETAKKAEENTRVTALNAKIADLERQLVAGREKGRAFLGTQIKLDRVAVPGKPGAKKIEGKPAQIRFRAIPNKEAIVKLEKAERRRAQEIVEQRFEAIAIGTLSSEVATRVQAETRGIRAQEGERGFALLIGLRERAALGLTPQQVTRLQLLQADFLRRYAPLREESEVDVVFSVVGKPALTLSEVKGSPIKFEKTTPTFEAVPATPAKPPIATKAGDVVYVFEATPAQTTVVKAGKPLTVPGKSFTARNDIRYSVVLAKSNNDVEKRIQALKDEIDDKVFEILNDDQGKRLRRMVAVSLSPNP